MVIHQDIKGELKSIILHLEHRSELFSLEEILSEVRKKGIPVEHAEDAFHELVNDNYIHEVEGTEGLFSRTIWRNYSPAFEETPEY